MKRHLWEREVYVPKELEEIFDKNTSSMRSDDLILLEEYGFGKLVLYRLKHGAETLVGRFFVDFRKSKIENVSAIMSAVKTTIERKYLAEQLKSCQQNFDLDKMIETLEFQEFVDEVREFAKQDVGKNVVVSPANSTRTAYLVYLAVKSNLWAHLRAPHAGRCYFARKAFALRLKDYFGDRFAEYTKYV